MMTRLSAKQLKPEAQWEVEGGLRLSAMDVYRAFGESDNRFTKRLIRLF